MTLIFVDGFDIYQTAATELAQAGWVSVANTTTVAGRVAGRAVCGAGANVAMVYPFTSCSAVYAGFALQALTSVAADMISLHDTTNATNGPFTLAMRNGGVLVTLVGGVTVSVSPGGTFPQDGAYRHVGVSVNSNNTTGSYKVLVEGVTVLQAANIDTAVSTAGIFVSLRLLAQQNSGGTDDFYVGNTSGSAPYNALLGDCRVETLRPTSDSAVAWVQSPTTASNYLLVSDSRTSTGTFVQTSVVGARDVYGIGNLASVPVTVFAVIPQMYHQKLDAGSLPLRPYLEVSGVTAIGTNVTPLVSTLRWTQEIFITQPSGSAWNSTAVNNLLSGFETA